MPPSAWIISGQGVIPEKYKKYFTVWREIVLLPGDQYRRERRLHGPEHPPRPGQISQAVYPSHRSVDRRGDIKLIKERQIKKEKTQTEIR
jgi:hypothetical protein